MSTRGAFAPFHYRSIGRDGLRSFSFAQFQTGDVERFLGPVEHIRDEILDNACHVLTVVEAAGQPLGFFVTHPDRQDASCWWLGYLAVLPAACGRGLGRALLGLAIRRLAGIPGCSRIRLLVHPDNQAAMQLYRRFGFAPEGICLRTGELVLSRGIDRGIRIRRSSMCRLSLRRRTAAERSPARVCAVWGTVLPGRAPPVPRRLPNRPPTGTRPRRLQGSFVVRAKRMMALGRDAFSAMPEMPSRRRNSPHTSPGFTCASTHSTSRW